MTLQLDAVARLFLPLLLAGGVLLGAYAGLVIRGRVQRLCFFAAYVALLMAMLGVLLAQDWMSLAIFWALSSLAAFLLMGKRRLLLLGLAAAMLLVTGGALSHSLTGSWLVEGALLLPGEQGILITGIFLLAAATGSAQWPLLMLSLALLFKLLPFLGGTALWNLLTLLGLFGFFMGAWRALMRKQLHDTLTYATISQLALLCAMLGLATPASLLAAALQLGARVLGEAPLLLAMALPTSGPVRAAAWLAALSLVGVPGTLGYVAQERLLQAAWEFWPLPIFLMLGQALAVATTLRLLKSLPCEIRPSPSRWRTAGAVALVGALPVLSLLLGLFPQWLQPLWNALAQMNAYGPRPDDLRAWHAFDGAFAMIVGGWALGLALHLKRG